MIAHYASVMELIPLSGADGSVMMWVNARHVAVIVRLDRSTGDGVQVRAELKLEGMPLIRVNVGDYASAADADAAWTRFLGQFER